MSSQFRTRGYSPFAMVHFTCRGYRRKQIFRDEFDHRDFLDTLRGLIDGLHPPIAPALLAYAQMPNHQHIFLRAGENGDVLPKLMRSLCTRYALAHNARHRLRGPVFQRPFRGRVVVGGSHLINTFAYIHLNPDASVRHSNSSHGFYAGENDDSHIDPEVAWKAFGGRDGYLEFFANTERLRAARAAAKWRFDQ